MNANAHVKKHIWMAQITYHYHFLEKVGDFLFSETTVFTKFFYCNILPQPLRTKHISIASFSYFHLRTKLVKRNYEILTHPLLFKHLHYPFLYYHFLTFIILLPSMAIYLRICFSELFFSRFGSLLMSGFLSTHLIYIFGIIF